MAQHVEKRGLEKEYEVLGLTNRILNEKCATTYKHLCRTYRLRPGDAVSVEAGFKYKAFQDDPTLSKLSPDEQIDVLERIVLGVDMFPNAIPALERHACSLKNVSKTRLIELKASCKCGTGFE
jgi:hypothetical protein